MRPRTTTGEAELPIRSAALQRRSRVEGNAAAERDSHEVVGASGYCETASKARPKRRSRRGRRAVLAGWVAMLDLGFVAGSVLLLAGSFLFTGLATSSETPVPLVVRAPHWNPPVVSEGEFLAARILMKEGSWPSSSGATHRELSRVIEEVLSRVRSKYPGTADVRARGANEPPEGMILELEPELLDAVSHVLGPGRTPVPLRTGREEFDRLNALLGLRAVEVFPSFDTAAFHYAGPLDFLTAANLYSLTEGVRSVAPNVRLGDGPDVDLSRSQAGWSVVFRKAWGDCPSGCIFRELLFFTVEGERVERIDAKPAMDLPGFAEIVATRGWRPPATTPSRGSNPLLAD